MKEFTDNKNKGLIWNILYEQKIFNNIPDTHVKEIKYIFDKEISNICQSNLNENVSLIDLNKIAIQVISGRIQVYKEENNNFYDKQKEMQISLNKKQAEFNELMVKETPKKPNFIDKKDEPFNSNNMTSLLNQMISAREQQLNQVLTIENDKDTGVDLNEDTNKYTEPLKNNLVTTSTPILRIGSNLSLADENITEIPRTQNLSKTSSNIDIPGTIQNTTTTKLERSVSFTDDNPDKFLQNLKKMGKPKINDDYSGEQKFNEQSKLDAISNQLNALMEKVNSIERSIERRDSMSSRSSYGSISMSPPN